MKTSAAFDPLFDRPENRNLLAICARRLIRQVGLGGIAWGLINVVFGALAIRETWLGAGALGLGVLMLGTGMWALGRPSLGILLAEAVTMALLLAWNVAIAILVLRASGEIEIQSLVVPLLAAAAVGGQYARLRPLRDLVAAVDPAQIKSTKQVCAALRKLKLKNEPAVVETADRRTRVRLLPDRAFLVQHDLLRAFILTRDEAAGAIADRAAKAWKLRVEHPLGAATFRFDRKNTEKLRVWLGGAPDPENREDVL
ncbi:MAG: hypothetical protein KA248_04485 [Kiritimatiellae bacterium]|nr:hypothetical protein [Kiritimatiellia bacterium]